MIMIKTLRYSLLSLLVLVCGSVFAQKETLWAENFSSYAANDAPAGGDYGYACVGSGTKVYAENLAGGESPELLIGKSGGSFSVTIPMNGKSGEMTLRFKANRTLSVTSDDATIGDKTNTGNDYTIPVTVAEGTASVTLQFDNTSSKNIRFDNAELFIGESKKAPGLSWGVASRDVTIGSEENNFPTLSNENNLAVAYSSDNTEVATMSNTPTKLSFSLFVERHSGVKQTLTAYQSSGVQTWVRNFYNGTWGSWVQVGMVYSGASAPSPSLGLDGNLYVKIES